ncbi:mirror-image polydactyly gene 1 protein isoform X1 [Hypanus sabinus]|uniref:mirror-image polydactyly gene 1 protein isoform X1 n=1 Tax=Hypanus sabinus TaxID=79690 RepID=UPI0028C4E806|nr:mirror-image polydactyly gene 1 protein isoform X1 [Hypanus sabinus]XP_059812591.1 mirror-image polydactyly gene 1 protein isoform X1 [Hypanus sabinus]XP_059812600.1 mirror-image polydactyly gene 1 protein isoform X1 [Hypanus sabinus]
MEENARSQIQTEDYKHGSQNINERWMQENAEETFYNQGIKNLKTTHYEKDQAKHLASQVVDSKDEPLQSCQKIINDSTKFKNYTNDSSNLLQVNEHARSSEKSEVPPSLPNYSQQFIPVDSSDLKDQQNYDFSQTCSSSMKGNECNASRHVTDTLSPLQKCSTVTVIPVFSAPNCQQTNSKMKLDIQSEMDNNNIRRAESGGTIALHDPFTPGQVNKHSEDNRRIGFLLKELNAVKESNKKLQDQLSENEEEMEVLKLNLELQDKAVEARVAEKAAVLIEEIYGAQSERDAAVMSRLRLANEERDEALLKSKQLEQAFEGLENINPEENDMTLQELLNRINNADSRCAVDKNGDLIVDKIHKARERKKRITAEEMNAVIEERDAALSRCKWLEEELHLLKEQNQSLANNTRQLNTENNQECALKAQLISMQKERDIAFQQCKKQDEEIQTLRLYYSLHKSLSQEATLTDQLNLTLGTYDNALRVSKDIISTTHHRNEDLASQLQLAMTEHTDMEMKLQQALGEKNELIEKVQKLERLVDVLRKKVGTGNVRTVT